MRIGVGSWFAERQRALVEKVTLGHDLFWSDSETDFEGADVLFGQPSPERLLQAASVRWVQLTSAGYARYDRDDLRAAFTRTGAALTNSSSVYAEPCAEHLLMFMLAQARAFPAALSNQFRDRAWPIGPIRARSVLLLEQTVVIVGFGAIGRRLCELLAPLTKNVIAVRERVRGDEPVETHPVADLPSLVAGAAHVVNALPDNQRSRRLFDAELFARFAPGAIFYNVGRGGTVDQPALIAALTDGRLGAAYLDVCSPEPAPPDDPLWHAPNCYITPHSAGGHANEEERLIWHFGSNLERFARGLELTDRVY